MTVLPTPTLTLCRMWKRLPGFASTDVGIIVLSEPVPTSVVSEYAELPDEGLVDTLRNKTPVDFVGYGVQEQILVVVPRSGLVCECVFTPSELVSGNFNHSDEFMKLALNPGGGSGGTCFGDSGGPTCSAARILCWQSTVCHQLQLHRRWLPRRADTAAVLNGSIASSKLFR